MDYIFTKMMLYISPHKSLTTVLQRADPILATSFYIWYIQNHGREFLTRATKDTADVRITILSVAKFGLFYLLMIR